MDWVSNISHTLILMICNVYDFSLKNLLSEPIKIKSIDLF